METMLIELKVYQHWFIINLGLKQKKIVPDQVFPASDTISIADSGADVAGTLNECSRRNHVHSLNVSAVLLKKNIAVDSVGTATTFARSFNRYDKFAISQCICRNKQNK
ncbi:MAG: hypothetical protein EZS28_009876 [Streblomastix strix]|uniref:Uncharacterized protein n=1 Tax=Streblomastix strix TaxID=222440 RepID=A0A5J4WIP1_9EUKA|nr:MAG: hypothetical protein EZS28_009876 [Streblomastix strix]